MGVSQGLLSDPSQRQTLIFVDRERSDDPGASMIMTQALTVYDRYEHDRAAVASVSDRLQPVEKGNEIIGAWKAMGPVTGGCRGQEAGRFLRRSHVRPGFLLIAGLA